MIAFIIYTSLRKDTNAPYPGFLRIRGGTSRKGMDLLVDLLGVFVVSFPGFEKQ
jgi:hypothetical protein